MEDYWKLYYKGEGGKPNYGSYGKPPFWRNQIS
jgi:hypothetical protein